MSSFKRTGILPWAPDIVRSNLKAASGIPDPTSVPIEHDPAYDAYRRLIAATLNLATEEPPAKEIQLEVAHNYAFSPEELREKVEREQAAKAAKQKAEQLEKMEKNEAKKRRREDKEREREEKRQRREAAAKERHQHRAKKEEEQTKRKCMRCGKLRRGSPKWAQCKGCGLFSVCPSSDCTGALVVHAVRCALSRKKGSL